MAMAQMDGMGAVNGVAGMDGMGMGIQPDLGMGDGMMMADGLNGTNSMQQLSVPT